MAVQRSPVQTSPVFTLDLQQSPTHPPSRLHPWMDGPVRGCDPGHESPQGATRMLPSLFPFVVLTFLRSTRSMTPHPQLSSSAYSRPSYLQAGVYLNFFGSIRQVVGLGACRIGNKLARRTLTLCHFQHCFLFSKPPPFQDPYKV